MQVWLCQAHLLHSGSMALQDFYHVKWKGHSETTWQPDENLGLGLFQIKEEPDDEIGGRCAKGGDSKKRKRAGKTASQKSRASKRKAGSALKDIDQTVVHCGLRAQSM